MEVRACAGDRKFPCKFDSISNYYLVVSAIQESVLKHMNHTLQDQKYISGILVYLGTVQTEISRFTIYYIYKNVFVIFFKK